MATNILALPLANVSFAISNNEDWIDSLVYMLRSETGDPSSDQLDLRGISFEMELRRAPPDHEVILQASTADGTLSIGAAPNVGYLIWYVPLATMQYIAAGNYVGDVRARDDEFERVCLTLDVTINQGITR